VRRCRHGTAERGRPDHRLLPLDRAGRGNAYTFYGYGDGKIPNGDAGWRIEAAPDPTQCSLQYTYNGTGVPVVKVNATGC